MQQSNLPSPIFIPLCATVKSTIPEFYTFLCNSQIYHPRVSYLSVQQSNLPSPSFIPFVQQSNLPSPSFVPFCATVKSTILKFHTSLCNCQIYHPLVSYLSVQQSNPSSKSFIPLCATVESTIPEFHTSVQQSNLLSPSVIPMCMCNSQIYHPRVSYLSACTTVKSTNLSVQQSNLRTSLCNSQILL